MVVLNLPRNVCCKAKGFNVEGVLLSSRIVVRTVGFTKLLVYDKNYEDFITNNWENTSIKGASAHNPRSSE